MLESSRLKLVPLSHEQLLLYKHNPVQLAQDLNVNYVERHNDPSVDNDLKEALEFWITNTQKYRDQFQWYTNWEIILKESNLAIGGIGFAGPPDTEEKSMVGYGLDIRHHGFGYASEALELMLRWAFANGLYTAIADTPHQNLASQKVLIKNGFLETTRDSELIHWHRKNV